MKRLPLLALIVAAGVLSAAVPARPDQIVIRNSQDADLGRPILPPVVTVSTVAAIKAAMLVAGTYTIAAGTYVGDFTASIDGVTLICLPGVILTPATAARATFIINASHFTLKGSTTDGSSNCEIHGSTNEGVVIGSNTATVPGSQPDDVTFDSVNVSPITTGNRGFAIHGSHVTIIRCRIEGYYRIGQEVQAIWVNNGPGPITVQDSYLEGAGENILFGGDVVNIPNNVPSNILIKGNTFYKPDLWRPVSAQYPTSIHATVKNVIEFKNAQHVVVEDNVIDGIWADGQTGDAMQITVRNSGATLGHDNPWVIVDDIVIRHNIFRRCDEANSFVINILGHDDNGRSSQQTQTISITNNLFEDAPGIIQVNSGVATMLTIDHNTFVATVDKVLQYVNNGTLTPLTMTKNFGSQGFYGVKMNGGGDGASAIDDGSGVGNSTVTGNIWGKVVSHNVIWPSGNTVRNIGAWSLTAAPEYLPAGADTGADAGWSGP